MQYDDLSDGRIRLDAERISTRMKCEQCVIVSLSRNESSFMEMLAMFKFVIYVQRKTLIEIWLKLGFFFCLLSSFQPECRKLTGTDMKKNFLSTLV